MRKYLIGLLLLVAVSTQAQIKVAKIPGTIFEVDVYVLVTKDLPKAHQFVQKIVDSAYELKDFDNNVGMTFSASGKPIVLWIPALPKTIEDFSVINHEVLHLIWAILSWVHIPLSDDTEEVYAYMTSYYTRIIYTILSTNEKK